MRASYHRRPTSAKSEASFTLRGRERSCNRKSIRASSRWNVSKKFCSARYCTDYRLTGSTTYKTGFENIWDSMTVYGNNGGPFDHGVTTDLGYFGDLTTDHRVMPDFLQGYLHGPAPRSNIVDVARSHFESEATNDINRTYDPTVHAFRNSRPSTQVMDWGYGTVPSRFLDQMVSRSAMGGLTTQTQQSYLDALSANADYILGANPAGLVYISGLGSRHSTDNLHLDLMTFEKEGKPQMPGIPEYGPVNSFPQNDYYQGSINAFYPLSQTGSALPPAFRFGDTKVFVASSEFDSTMTMAPLAALFANLLMAGQAPPASYLPGGTEHLNPITAFGTPTNRAPVVEAGWAQTITMPDNNAQLDGQMVDDGLSGSGVTTTWSVVSGSGSVTFDNANLLNATATFSNGGVYVLRLTANDGLLTTTDDVTIKVKDPRQGIFYNGD